MFGLSTIKARNARAAMATRNEDGVYFEGFGRVGGKHQKKTDAASAVVFSEPIDFTLTPLKPVPIEELLAWTKKQKTESYSFTNGEECGCFMTEHLLDTRYVRRDTFVASNGRIVGPFGYQKEPVYPFHNRFWEPFLQGGGYQIRITRAQAIARLKYMIANPVK